MLFVYRNIQWGSHYPQRVAYLPTRDSLRPFVPSERKTVACFGGSQEGLNGMTIDRLPSQGASIVRRA